MTITLYENFRGVLYAPFYAPLALGAYAAEGLDVRLETPDSPAAGFAGLMDGRTDVMWGGPLRIMLNHDQDPACDIVGFCEVIERDPFYLVGREPRADFDFTDLATLRLGSVSEVPTPWICLAHDIRLAGLDPAVVDRVTDNTMAENTAALGRGDIDVAQLFEPYVEELVRSGRGHIWNVAAGRGLTAYTSLYTRRGLLESRREIAYGMTRAVYRSLRWVHSHSADEFAAAVADFFPAIPQEVLAGCFARYKAGGAWGTDPILRREGFDWLKQAMLADGFLSKDIPYEDCIDTTIAEAVVAEDPPPL